MALTTVVFRQICHGRLLQKLRDCGKPGRWVPADCRKCAAFPIVIRLHYNQRESDPVEMSACVLTVFFFRCGGPPHGDLFIAAQLLYEPASRSHRE